MEADYLNGVLITESKVCPHTGNKFDADARRNHALLGIITELGELIDPIKKYLYYGKEIDVLHEKEELGDLFWYIGLGFNVEGIIAANPDLKIEGTLDLPLAMHIITDHTLPFDDRLQYVYRTAVNMVRSRCYDYQEILDMNLAKLRKRYGDSFDADRAINRDTKAEHDVIATMEK